MSVYLYCRVSTDKQDNGKAAQLDRLMQWAEREGVTFDETYIDEDVSAHSVRLQDRPAGKLLWDRLETGDIVVATKMDRMFRRLADMATTIDAWKQIGVRLKLLDMDVDIESPHGRAFAGFTAVAAQLESELHGQRKREVFAHKRRTGQPYSWVRPYGWTRAKDKRGKLSGYAPDERERKLGHRILAMRRGGQSWWSIASAVCLAGDRKPCAREGAGYYHVRDIRSLACAAAAGFPTVPQGFWQAPDYEQRLRAMIADGFQLSFGECGRFESGPERGVNLHPDPRSPSRGSRATPTPAVDPQPLAG